MNTTPAVRKADAARLYQNIKSHRRPSRPMASAPPSGGTAGAFLTNILRGRKYLATGNIFIRDGHYADQEAEYAARSEEWEAHRRDT
mgnify:CR=1 FL=1